MGMCRNYIEKGKCHAVIPGKWKVQVYGDVASERAGTQDGSYCVISRSGLHGFRFGVWVDFVWVVGFAF